MDVVYVLLSLAGLCNALCEYLTPNHKCTPQLFDGVKPWCVLLYFGDRV